MLPALIGELGVPALAQILGEALGRVDNPIAKGAARALGQLDQAMSEGQLSIEDIREANRHAEEIAQLQVKQGEAVNESLRLEIASDDKYVRRMRPTFGYLMAATWAAQMFGLAYVIVFRTAQAHIVIESMQSLGMIWTMGLSVLGVYVYKRSEEKKFGGRPGTDFSSTVKGNGVQNSIDRSNSSNSRPAPRDSQVSNKGQNSVQKGAQNINGGND